MTESLKIAILLFENFTVLDVAGPYEVLSKIPDSRIYMVATEPGLYANDCGLKVMADYSISEIVSPDVLVIPGGFGIDGLLENQKLLDWIKNAYVSSKWTISVCSGALLLGAAGILKNRKATTHWDRKKQLAEYGAIIQNERYVKDGTIITSAGVSAGIDMTLYFLSIIVGDNFARGVQLGIEYDPKPPFSLGIPEKAPKELVNMISKSARIADKR